MYSTLGEFLGALEASGELARVSAPVSPNLEIAEVADRQSRLPAPVVSRWAAGFDPAHCGLGGRAVLFENVQGCDFPLAINVFGSYRRTEMALGCEGSGGFEAIARRIEALIRPEPPRSLRDLLGKVKTFAPLLRTPPRRVRRGVCQEVVRLASRGEVDLRRIPLIQCWPLDGDLAAVGWDLTPCEAGRVQTTPPAAEGETDYGRYITIAGMHTIHADEITDTRPASHNIGMYRAQLLDATHLVMHWHIHHDGAAHWRSWRARGQRMPIAICLGGEALLPYAATAPLPPGLSELLLAGFLNGRGIRLVRARTVPLWVPANSEIVIEGYVETGGGLIGYEPRREVGGGLLEPLGRGAVIEGPFGDHTGFYSLPDRYPIVEVTAVTHRRDAVFPATIVGPPPQEDYYLGKATERIFRPLLKMLIPDIEDYHLPLFGCFHNCVFVRICKAYPLQARRVMHAIWGAGQMAWEKFIVVVDDDVDVHDETAVLRAMFHRCDFLRDTELVNGPLDILDHAAARLGAGGKLGFDATIAIAGEEVCGVPVGDGESLPADSQEAARRLLGKAVGQAGIEGVAVPAFGGGRCVFLGVAKTAAGAGPRAIDCVWDIVARASQKAVDHVADFVIAVDAGVDLNDWENVLFHFCANTDPGRDLHRRDHRLGVDATRKLPGDERCGQPVRDYPPYMEMDAETKDLVTRRWAEYGFGQAMA
ncbi:MAG: UbiD family decarboxylase [Planctomycetes bacterium]|nr:UbiD family decarboxylase [Planctomycetota bacterium]